MTSKPRKPRQLTEQEAELWSKVTRTTVPLDRGREDAAPHGTDEGVPPPPKDDYRAPEVDDDAPAGLERTPPAANEKAPPLADFEAKVRRQLNRGRRAIEARIDLHGMTRNEAHEALLAFLAGARAKGYLHALVITGKGTDGAEDDDLVAIMTRERGVLRQAVRQWLTLPEFRSHVVSFSEAGPRHGGSGALYVRLRRADG